MGNRAGEEQRRTRGLTAGLLPIVFCLLPALAACQVRRDHSRQPPPPKSTQVAAAVPDAWRRLFDPLDAPPSTAAPAPGEAAK
jgi:hypothetical protein